MADAYIILSDATSMLDEYWNMKPIWHENRFGTTARHINRVEKWVGGGMHKKSVTKMLTNARADATLEAVMPDSTKIDTEDIEIQEANLRRTAASIGYSLPASMELSGDKHSVWNISAELARQTAKAMLEKKDQMIQANAQSSKAAVAAKYLSTGGTFTGTPSTCFITLTGQVGMFHNGELVDIRIAATDVKRVTAVVSDVWTSEQMLGVAVGPGLVLTYSAVGDSSTWADGGGDTDFNNVAAGDEIVAKDERIADGYPGSFSALCNFTATPGAYFSVADRAAVGSRHWIPNGYSYSSSTTLDLDTDFGRMFNVMTRMFPLGRSYLDAQGIKWSDAVLCQGSPEIIQEATRQAGDASARFTKQMANELGTAERQRLTAVTGWDGVVIRTPGLPPMAMEPDCLMPTDKIRIWDPAQWCWVRMGGKDAKPKWLRDGGGIWHLTTYASGSAGDNKLKPHMIAGCFVIDTLFCEKPKTVYELDNVADSI